MKLEKKVEFSFSSKNIDKAKEIISHYPVQKQSSAVLALLDLAQRQNNGWISNDCIEYVANFLNMPYIKVYEVASFYSMFNLKSVGKYHIQICGTTPCWLRGANGIMNFCQEFLKISCGQTSDNGLFTVSEVECLGACINAPVVQINDCYYENLTNKKMENIIINLKAKQSRTKS